jgi:hypothetical protein
MENYLIIHIANVVPVDRHQPNFGENKHQLKTNLTYRYRDEAIVPKLEIHCMNFSLHFTSLNNL